LQLVGVKVYVRKDSFTENVQYKVQGNFASVLSNVSVKYKLYKDIKCTIKIFPVHAMKAHRDSRGTAPLILNVGTRWR
jgi:hypothetical protein